MRFWLYIDNSRSLLGQAQKKVLKGTGYVRPSPKKNGGSFLTALQLKPVPGTPARFKDRLQNKGFLRERADYGNRLGHGILPNTRSFMIIKDFPEEKAIKNALSAFADDIQYTRRPDEDSWGVFQ